MGVQSIKSKQKRLRILGDEEIETIYGKPRFTEEERTEYFLLSPTEKAELKQFNSIKSKVCFILQLGYFKARHIFFTFSLSEVAEDARFILEQYFPNSRLVNLVINKLTRLKQQRLILKLCRYRSCGGEERKQFEIKARQVAMVCGKPIYVFRELINYLEEHRISVPGYRFMQDMIGKVLTYEQKRLETITHNCLKPVDIEALKCLLEDSTGLYEITKLKHEPRDFSAGEIKREIHRGQQIHQLYLLAAEFLPHTAEKSPHFFGRIS